MVSFEVIATASTCMAHPSFNKLLLIEPVVNCPEMTAPGAAVSIVYIHFDITDYSWFQKKVMPFVLLSRACGEKGSIKVQPYL